ncbi:MAG TPA: DUF58 domain-containing protein [Chloroflexia bacterium]|nr:DUF58 domain-containing protein [Chloroflexia bacterium]
MDTTSKLKTQNSELPSYTQLFDAEFMRKLERLSLVSRKLKSGRLKGERRSPKRGQSVEFADYRTYSPGDDLRRVDWNAYARMERLFIKLFQEEEDLTVHVLLDASKSMDWGDPNDVILTAPIAPIDGRQTTDDGRQMVRTQSDTADQNKLIYAKRVAAALGYISLTDLDRLSVTAFSKSGIQRFTPVRGKGYAISLLRFIAGVKAEGQTDLDLMLRQYASQAKYPGLLFLLSDCLVDGGGIQGLSALQAAGHEINLIHILSPAEVHPELALIGDLRLKDVETGATQDVSIDGAILDLYREKYEQWQSGIENFCRRRGINYLHVTTDTPFEDLVLHYLRRKGILS